MSDEISVQPTALDALRRQITSGDAPAEEILLPLRALQLLGLTRADLRVHIERIRAANDVTDADEDIEENCLFALDIIEGSLPFSALRWDAAETARIHLPKAVRGASIRRGLESALEPSDMLPPRPSLAVTETQKGQIVQRLTERLAVYDVMPQPADFYRVPKAGMTTRPAALLAPYDRVIFEALAQEIDSDLEDRLPQAVSWPRSTDTLPSYSSFVNLPKGWSFPYIVTADVESFYECIDHTLLAGFIGSELGRRTSYLSALEAFLDTVMSSHTGLPQGPNASDVFASAYLLPVDSVLTNQAWSYARYADDFLVGAESIVDGRRKIESLEGILREIGLRLNVSKTKVMRRETYLAHLGKPSQQVENLRGQIQKLTERRIRNSEDESDMAEILEEVGVEEETLWDLFYHQTTTLDEVLDEVRELLKPPLVDSYAEYFIRVARRLRREKLPDDMPSTERDLRECLVILASAQRAVNLTSVDEVLKWFPPLAQHASAYLNSIANEQRRPVSDLIIKWLDPPADTDWVTAWLCNSVERNPTLISQHLQEILLKLIKDQRAGLLTRAGAARALAAGRKLDQDTFNELLQSATPAIRSELALAALADPVGYPNAPLAIE